MTSGENYPSPERAYDYPKFEQHWTEFARPPQEVDEQTDCNDDVTEASPLVDSCETQSDAGPACGTDTGCNEPCGGKNWSDAPEGAVGAVDDMHCVAENNNDSVSYNRATLVINSL